MKTRFEYGVLVLGMAALISCGGEKTKDSSLKDGSADNLFACENASFGWTNCHVTRTKVAPAEGIHATFRVRYDSSCTVGGSVWQSKLKFRIDQSYSDNIVYGQSGTLVAEGSGNLEIVDSDPNQTSKEYFDIERPCGLSISYEVEPSTVQVGIWTKESDDLANLIDAQIAVYNLRADVDFWYQTYIKDRENPTVKTILQQQIDALNNSGKELDKLKAKKLKEIIDNVPEAKIFEPFEIAKKAIQSELVPAAERLKVTMVKWKLALDSHFVTALEEAKRTVDGHIE